MSYHFVFLILLTLGGGYAMTKPSSIELSSLLAEGAKYFIERLQLQNSLEHEAEDHSFPETRGGYGHGGGGHGHGAITLDPVSIISLLALGAFLINNILQLLRSNMNVNAGRSLNSFDGLPVPLPPISFSSIDQSGEHEPSFSDFFGNLGSLYYLQPKKRHMCMKRVVCNYIHMKESRESQTNALKTKLFDFMLSTVAKIVAPEIDEGKDERCQKAQKYCSDALLKDARISAEFKVYSQVSTWLTKLAFNGLTSG